MGGITTQTILVGAGIIFIFFGIIGHVIIPKSDMWPNLTKWTRICLVMIGITFLSIGILYFPHSVATATPTTISPPAQLDSSKSTASNPDTIKPTKPYMVYSDIGIASGDVWIWSGADWGLNSPILEDGSYVIKDAPEGTTCFAVKSGSGNNNYIGWGVFLGIFDKNHKVITPDTVDLSAYRNLEFWIKTPVDLKVEIQQNDSEGNKSFLCLINNYGWNGNSPDVWQKVTIPKSAFRNVDLTKVFCPFMITGKGGEITFYVDEVMWTP